MLYKLKTSKVFEKPKPGEGRAAELVEEDPFAIQMVSWCPQSRIFCVVGISAHIILYRFSKYDANTQIVVSEIRIKMKSDILVIWYDVRSASKVQCYSYKLLHAFLLILCRGSSNTSICITIIQSLKLL